jgi:predicted ATPase/class 3 adenylate cyclase
VTSTDLIHKLAAIFAADAVGFARLMADDERAAVAALEQARTVFRAQIEAHQGRVIDMAGDFVLAAFEAASGALGAALAIQQQLSVDAPAVNGRRMQFRIGIHVGDVFQKHDGTMYGDGINIAARLQGLAEPGGVAVSEAVRTVVGGRVEAEFVDLGEPPLKNISEIVRAFAVRPAGAGEPAPASAPASAERFAFEPVKLFGRDEDIEQLSRWVARDRLVTLLGTGGVGKTQVARRVFRNVASSFAGDVAWVDLSPLASRQHVLTSIANAAAVQLADNDSDAVAGLSRALAGRRMLLVLDNSEHLVPDVCAVVQAVLFAATGVHILVTSQQVLKLAAERVYRLEPLALPPQGMPSSQAAGFPAVEMLLERASAAHHRFALTAQNGDDIVALSNQLDGLPLAIEMAAAWLPKLGARSLLARLSEWRQLLRAPSHGMPPRQQTLRSTLEWSHSLLEPAQQEVLHRLSAFAGTFRIDLVHPVAGDDSLDESATLEVLGTLIDKSLVQAVQLEPPRYRLLETMRVYAGERLEAEGGATHTYARLGRVLAGLAREVESRFWDMGDRDWLDLYAPEYDDLQIAFDRACAVRDVGTAALIGTALQRMDHLRSVTTARRRRAELLFAMLQEANDEAKAWIWTCLTSHNMISLEIVSRIDASTQALAAWRRMSDPMRLHFALGFHANECARAGDFEAADRALAESASLEKASWPVRRRMWGASARAGVCIHRGDAAGYRESCRIELALADMIGAERTAAAARLKLADAALMAGELPEAIALGEVAVRQLRILDQPANLGLALSNLCSALVLAGRRIDAMAAAREALPLLSRSWGPHFVLDALALVAAELGLFEDAARLMGHVENWYATHADQRQPNEEHIARLAKEAIESGVGETRFDAARQEGVLLSQAEAEFLASRIASGEALPAGITGHPVKA